MIKKIMSSLLVALLFILSEKTWGMELESPKVQEISLPKYMVYNMWLIQNRPDVIESQGLSIYPRDIYVVIFRMLRDLLKINPILDGELVYGNQSYRMRKIINQEGTVNIYMLDKAGGKNIGIADKYLIITTSVERFFKIDNRDMLVYLIAPWSLIMEKIETVAKQFEPILSEWNTVNSFYGVFMRKTKFKHLDSFWYIIDSDQFALRENNLGHLWFSKKSSPTFVDQDIQDLTDDSRGRTNSSIIFAQNFTLKLSSHS